ncbi:MAG: 30S ribosome-binding factor RbfA [Anaerovoracaceae bacterium]|jgi:ribosome-binding factor A
MGKGYRQGRLAEEIKKLISEMLLRELKDPRLTGMVSITGVDVSPDSSYATVYLSVFTGSDEDHDEAEANVLAALGSSKGLIRRKIGKNMKLRHVPELTFKIDTSMEYGRHIEELIDKVKKDEEK